MSLLADVANVIGFLILTVGFIIKNTIRLFIPEKYKMKSIAGEIALVTGGGGVLGRLVTLRLANLGAIVVIWDVNKAGIEETVKLVKSAGGICYGYVCDLCDREDIYKKAEQVKKEVGKVTILINNAGIGNGYRLLDTPDNLIIRTMEVNVMSHFWTTKAFLPSMIEDNRGHIVSIASMAGHIGVSHLVSYCTSKFAAIGFDEALHMELVAEGYNINSTVVCPFFIRSTGMFDNVSTRYLPRLTPNDVADRIISAIRCNEKVAIVPGYLCILLILKWAFPWECAGMLVRGLLLNKIHPSDSSSPPEKLKQFGCLPQEIRTSSPATIKLVKDSNFQDMEPERIPIQLRPQRIKVSIPPRSEITIPIRYRLAKNYPLDLYYLMDLTWSMRDDKETLIRLGWNMSQTFGSITNNFRLGFGSYADKPVMPYIFPGHEENPCKSEHTECSPIYSYWHRLKLTGDIQRFITEVNNSQVTGNVDNLEGALDGLVQAIVCTNEINWARQARKIILVATDGHLHTAGDGKLGGAVKRQDFKCHLDERGQYSLAAQFDYSSLAELSRLLQEYKINVIFAVTEERRNEYEEIVKLLREKATVATLTSDSSNILDIIENAYHRITSKLILRDNSSSPLIMEYFSNCGEGNVSEWNTLECDNIKQGQVYDFKVVLSYKECPRDKDLWRQRVVIQDELASQLSNIIIDVEFLCGCNCKDTESSYCQHGTYECGLCKCDSGWSGETCDCDESSLSNNVQQCIRDNSTKICSERGDCVCGKCFCDDGYKGEFCECSACDKMDGIECSNKGTCNCGVCQCIEGWEGNACQCPSTNELCIAPGSQEICAGHGYCDCGECRCNVTAADGFYYRGTYCESTISTGGSGLCVLYERCVNATVEDPKKANEFCQTSIATYNIERVESVDIGDGHHCFVKTVMERTTCYVHYVYEFQKNNVVTLKIGNKQCHTLVHGAVIPSIIIIGTACLGLAFLLIWKCWTSIKDRREYEKFMKEQQKTVFSLNQNPLFKSPISRYSVPSMYKEN